MLPESHSMTEPHRSLLGIALKGLSASRVLCFLPSICLQTVCNYIGTFSFCGFRFFSTRNMRAFAAKSTPPPPPPINTSRPTMYALERTCLRFHKCRAPVRLGLGFCLDNRFPFFFISTSTLPRAALLTPIGRLNSTHQVQVYLSLSLSLPHLPNQQIKICSPRERACPSLYRGIALDRLRLRVGSYMSGTDFSLSLSNSPGTCVYSCTLLLT
ncbi:hypothetical protein B0H11DRAFT_495058 [Mycena galericulata]|nr:hypothetical protein B0H11DRAFT_495058 [Mycena galericulata]